MKLFRGIRQNLIKEGNLKRYLLYAIGEILLVMIGILLAFQVNNWNDNRIKKDNEKNYYQNIKEQISDDKHLINGQIEYNDRYMTQFKYANEILEKKDRSKLDTLGKIVKNLTSYSDLNRQGNIYETMVNSGEIKLLKNHDIIKALRVLEEKYIYINRMESIHYDAVMTYAAPAISGNIKFSSNEIMNKDEVFSHKFQNLVIILIQIMDEKSNTYKSTIAEIDKTIALIDKELEK